MLLHNKRMMISWITLLYAQLYFHFTITSLTVPSIIIVFELNARMYVKNHAAQDIC